MIAMMVFLCAAVAIALPAQTFTTVAGFDGTNGYFPIGALIQATDGSLYGTTNGGGATGYGTIFAISANDPSYLSTVYTFCPVRVYGMCPDGESPGGGLVQGADSYLYGTALYGGAERCEDGCGTMYRISQGGALDTVRRFCAGTECPVGQTPTILLQAADGDFYGTTALYGSGGFGALFKITPTGSLTVIYNFCSVAGCPAGAASLSALLQAPSGDLYGVTYMGGAYASGAIVKIGSSGTPIVLYSFCAQTGCPDGAGPNSLILASDGNFYGTTNAGGSGAGGTIFMVTSAGKLTTLYNFTCPTPDCTDVYQPIGLIEGSDGNFYGITAGGVVGTGMIFKMTPNGELTRLYNFCSQGCTDGSTPYAPLVQATNGFFYGTTSAGGPGCFLTPAGCGTIFSLSVGLAPFVKAQPAYGQVGAAVQILGSFTTRVLRVTFNGTPATFRVASGTVLGTTVPAGATTGPIEVVTADGTFLSNVPFRVAP